MKEGFTMRFTLNEWNEIYKAIKDEFTNITNRLATVTDRNDETRELLDRKITLDIIIEKLEDSVI